MARPVKVGVDYFPLDVDLDVKIDFIERKYANDGFAVIVKLWQKIYKENGYYCKWDSDIAELFAFRNANNISTEMLNGIIDLALKKELFNREVFEKYGVLTSPGIQKRYLLVTVKRKRIDLDKRYLLIDIPPNIVNVYINGVKVSDNSKKVDNNTQSKGKESKENKSKGNESNIISATDDSAAEIFKRYETLTGKTVSRTMASDIDSFIGEGIGCDLILAVMDYSVDGGNGNWNYMRGTLKNLSAEGIKTVKAWKIQRSQYKQRKRSEASTQKTKFNNFENSVKTDYDELDSKLVDMFMGTKNV